MVGYSRIMRRTTYKKRRSNKSKKYMSRKNRITALIPRTIKTTRKIRNNTVKSIKHIFDKTKNTLKKIPSRLNQGTAQMISSITK
jgi:hypothetical protein